MAEISFEYPVVRFYFSAQAPRSLMLSPNVSGRDNLITSCRLNWQQQAMGYVIVISLPVILLFLIAAIACYLIGRARGRQEAANATLPQYYGPPPPAPPVGATNYSPGK